MYKVVTLEKFLERLEYLKEQNDSLFKENQPVIKRLLFKWILQIYLIYFTLIGLRKRDQGKILNPEM